MNPDMNSGEGEKVVWDRKLFWKIMKWIGGILVFLFLFFTAMDYLVPKIDSYLQKKAQEDYIAKIKAEEKRLEELQKNDTYGGKTPEETLDLYIDALKKGDVELASRYSRVDQWEEALLDLNKAKQKDNLAFAIKFATDVRNNGKKTCNKDGCYMVYEYVNEKEEVLNIEGSKDTVTIPKGNTREKSIDFKLNPYTNVWKIVEP